jgi:hypothetical protein
MWHASMCDSHAHANRPNYCYFASDGKTTGNIVPMYNILYLVYTRGDRQRNRLRADVASCIHYTGNRSARRSPQSNMFDFGRSPRRRSPRLDTTSNRSAPDMAMGPNSVTQPNPTQPNSTHQNPKISDPTRPTGAVCEHQPQ